jgi:hypothetical protein
MLFFELSQKAFSVFEETTDFSRRFREGTFEVVSSPLNGMLYLIGEVFQCTERDTFLGRINYISIADSDMRNDDLRMAFSSQSSRLE